jgi:16S rRNA (guanine527-N7)-methyltransferase
MTTRADETRYVEDATDNENAAPRNGDPDRLGAADRDRAPHLDTDADSTLDRGLLAALARELGVTLDADQLAVYAEVSAEMIVWNERVNLTRITDPSGIARLHFADSLACLRGLPDTARSESLRCVDIGSGAGMPGLALAVACPSWQVTLMDSVSKKTDFLRHVAGALALKAVDVETARAEELGRSPNHRGRYDIAVARAVADLPVLAEYALPLLRVGGRLVALKGRDAHEEVGRAAGALDKLGGTAVSAEPYELGGGTGTRYVVAVDKVADTPDKYPRRAGIPAKRPLG